MQELSKKNLYNNFFSHIYVEEDAMSYPAASKVLSHYKKSNIIMINHYKDIFCRSHQNFKKQKECPSLILAVKKENLIYKGSPMCDDFGNANFYYTSSMMNCVYNCEYCYLQGMYPSADIVIFVNLEDIFKKVESLLKASPIYLCISYDTDILALEHILGYGRRWIEFAASHPDMKMELRTKSTGFNLVENIKPLKNVILAYTLSPDEITERYEHRTPPLKARLMSLKAAACKGWNVRICIDPILYIKNYQAYYTSLVDSIFNKVPACRIYDISIGTFRVSSSYLKIMRKNNKSSALLNFPFETKNGISTYSDKLTMEMVDFVYSEVSKHITSNKIYR